MRVITLKAYFALTRFPQPEPHHLFNVIPKTRAFLEMSITLLQEIQSAYYKPLKWSVIFKWSNADLNTMFSFSLSGCLTQAKETSPPYIKVSFHWSIIWANLNLVPIFFECTYITIVHVLYAWLDVALTIFRTK